MAPDIVSAPAGRFAGLRRQAGAAFLGIPFAQPPVGPLRWQPPRPLQPSQEVQPAVRSGPAPLQPQPARDTIMWHANFADRQPLVMSEDCLYLDVHTPDPDPSAGLPVLVWVHGGGNRFGYGHQDVHDPASLVAAGIVVVTLNYRLGPLGWLAHPALAAEADGAAGNYGLMDIVAALRWVQDNIGAFGGDPSAVTLGGNSAGAAHVCHLMAAGPAGGLFARAIGQSSAGLDRADGGLPLPAEAQEKGLRWAAGADLETLRRRSALDVMAGAGMFGPVLDGALLTEETTAVFDRGGQAPIPLLVGSNADEGSFYTLPSDSLPAFAPGHPFHEHYPATPSAVRRWVGDTRFVWPIWRWASTHRTTSGAPTWLYRFEQTPPLPPDLDLAPPRDGVPGFGAFHTAEIPYVWNSLHTRPWPWRDSDHRLAEFASAAWANFCRSGDPNGGVVPLWPRLDPASPQVMRLGDTLEASADPDASIRALHDQERHTRLRA